MKKSLTFSLTLSALLLSANVFAGSVTFQNVPTGPVPVTANTYEKRVDVMLTNSAATPKNFQGARILNAVQEGQESFFCWGICLGPGADSTLDPVAMAAGTSQAMQLHFRPNNVSGTATVTLRFYDETDHNDFSDLTIVFEVAGNVSNDPARLGTATLGLPFPAPARESFSVNYAVENSANAAIRLTDMAGREVTTQRLSGMSGVQRVSVANVPAGMYLLHLLVDEKSVATRKVVVE